MLITCPHCSARNRVEDSRFNDAPTCGKCQRELLAGAPVALDESNFSSLIAASRRPVAVDFWAPWCGPCRGFAPIFAQAAAMHPELLFGKVDTDANPQIAAQFAVRSIPTLALFAAGQAIERISGALPAQQLETWLAAGLLKARAGASL